MGMTLCKPSGDFSLGTLNSRASSFPLGWLQASAVGKTPLICAALFPGGRGGGGVVGGMLLDPLILSGGCKTRNLLLAPFGLGTWGSGSGEGAGGKNRESSCQKLIVEQELGYSPTDSF